MQTDSNQSSINDRTVYVVTGAAQGIGQAIGQRLAENPNHIVVLGDVQYERSVANWELEGDSIVRVHLDVSKEESWRRVFTHVSTTFGPLAGLVNNAGILRDKTLRKMSLEEWQAVIDVHLLGTWLGCKTALDFLKDDASIVNISSSGRFGSFGQSNYSAAKAGIVGLTRTVALEYGKRGIRANCVAPGPIETDMAKSVPEHVRESWTQNTTLKRLGQPHEIAAAVNFLLSKDASYITGQVLEVNGGELHL